MKIQEKIVRLVVLSVVIVDRCFGDDGLEGVASIRQFRKGIRHYNKLRMKRIMTERRRSLSKELVRQSNRRNQFSSLHLTANGIQQTESNYGFDNGQDEDFPRRVRIRVVASSPSYRRRRPSSVFPVWRISFSASTA